MRTFKDIYKDFCKYLVEKTGDTSYSYNNFVENSDDPKVSKGILYKKLLNLLRDRDNGVYYFCKFVIGDLQDIGYPDPFRYNGLMRKWDKIWKNRKNICIMCARGHGKTVTWNEIFNLYDMFIHKHRRVIIISASQEQTNHILSEIKTIVDNNEMLKRKKGEKWAAESIHFNKGYIIGKGIGGEILGQHVDRIIVDDILRQDNKLSDQEIEDYIDLTLSPMLLNRSGQLIVIGTPKSETDIFSELRSRAKSTGGWYFDKFPAIIDYDKKKLQCPDRFTWKEIMDKRLEMGATKFAREYQLEVFSREASLFPPKILNPAKDRGEEMCLLTKHDKRDPNWTYVAGVDVARSGTASADYSVMVVMAYNTINNTKQIVHFWRAKGLKLEEQAKQIARISRKFNNCYTLVEKNNMGQDMIDRLADDYNVNVDTFTSTSRTKGELVIFLVNAFEREQIVIPSGDEESKKKMQVLEEELEKFCETRTPAGNVRYEGLGEHDDCVIALALANKATQTASIPFAVTDFGSGGNSGDMYDSMVDRAGGNETDLVKKIRMGLIK